MSTPAQQDFNSNPASVCAARLSGAYQAPQTFFSTAGINTKRPKDFVERVRQAVETITHGGLSVRQASPDLFTEQWFWLHMAVGPYASFSPDKAVVGEHNDQHTLFGAFSTEPATLVVANKAPSELVEKRHEEAAEQYRRQMAEKSGLAALQVWLPRVLETLQERILRHSDPLDCSDAQERLTKLTQTRPQEVTLLQLATICNVLGLELAELLLEAS